MSEKLKISFMPHLPSLFHTTTMPQKFCPWFWQFIISSNHRNKLKNTNTRLPLPYNVKLPFCSLTTPGLAERFYDQIGLGGQVEIQNTNFQNSKQTLHDTTIYRFGH